MALRIGIGVAALAATVVAVLVLLGLGTDPERPSTLASALRARDRASAPFPSLTEARVAFDGRCTRVVVADSETERATGLRGRSDLGDYQAMVFVFPSTSTGRFTMSGVPVALDIGFYGADGEPVSRTAMQPCAGTEGDCPVYAATGPYRYAVETLRGGLGAGAIGACPG